MFHATEKGSKCVMWLSWLNCNLVIFHLILRQLVVENLFYNAQCGALLEALVLKVFYAQLQWGASRGTGSLHLRSWNCFVDNEAAFFMTRRVRWNEGCRMVQSQLGGQGSMWNKLPSWDPTCCKRQYTSTITRGCGYNLGNSELEVTPGWIFTWIFSEGWTTSKTVRIKSFSGWKEHIKLDKLADLATQYSKRYCAKAFYHNTVIYTNVKDGINLSQRFKWAHIQNRATAALIHLI